MNRRYSKYKGAIVIPALNEAQVIVKTLEALQRWREHWLIIISDGASIDNTQALAAPLADFVIQSPQGRALQLNEGALKARQELGVRGILVFLHADTLIPESFDHVMSAFLRTGRVWGRFDVKLSGHQRSLRLVEWMMNGRSRLTGIATGDQVLFYRATTFWQLYGFPVMPLMEDVEMSKRVKAFSDPYCPYERVITSSRKWEKEGIWRTIFLMWLCRTAYFFGASASQTYRWYYRKSP